MYFVTMKNIA